MSQEKRYAIGTALLTICLAATGVIVLQPQWLITALARRSPDVVYQVETTSRVVALTIDDGPDARSTPLILDLLDRYGARATFFLISDRIPGNEAIVRRVIQAGHEIANHLTTDEASILLRHAEFERRLLAAERMLAPFARPRWFRPGSGWYNDSMLAMIHQHGYRCALGSVYPFDPQIPSARFAARFVLNKARPGAVIVLHDCGARGRRTARALETILPALKARNYKIKTLSELVDMSAATGRPD